MGAADSADIEPEAETPNHLVVHWDLCRREINTPHMVYAQR